MIKPISAFVVSVLVIISLTGCGSGGSTPSAGNPLPSNSDGASNGETTPSTGETTSTGTAKLSWDPPQEGVAGFKVYYGTSPGTYTGSIDVGMTPSYTVSGLSSGSYYFAVTATDSSGNESGFSNEVSKTIS